MMTTEESFAQMALGSGDGDSDDSFPLLDRLREELPEVLERFVLPALDQTAIALLARAGKGMARDGGVLRSAVRGFWGVAADG
jgi:hypothetical protein